MNQEIKDIIEKGELLLLENLVESIGSQAYDIENIEMAEGIDEVDLIEKTLQSEQFEINLPDDQDQEHEYQRHESIPQEEIRNYIAEASKKKMEMINFWNVKQIYFPNIFKLVKDIIVIPATQTSSEREFSRAKLTKSDKRNRIHDDILQKLTVVSAYSSEYINKNKKRKRSISSDELSINDTYEEIVGSDEEVENSENENNSILESNARKLQKNSIILEDCKENNEIMFGFYSDDDVASKIVEHFDAHKILGEKAK